MIQEKDIENNLRMASLNFPNLIIDLKFVVFHDGNRGKLTDKQIQGQINILNDAYGGKQHYLGTDSKMLFQSKIIQYVDNTNYFYKCAKFEQEINSKYPGATDTYYYLHL